MLLLMTWQIVVNHQVEAIKHQEMNLRLLLFLDKNIRWVGLCSSTIILLNGRPYFIMGSLRVLAKA